MVRNGIRRNYVQPREQLRRDSFIFVMVILHHKNYIASKEQPLIEDGLLPHYNRLTWEVIYQGWTRSDLQYYWRDMNVQTVRRQINYHEQAASQMADNTGGMI